MRPQRAAQSRQDVALAAALLRAMVGGAQREEESVYSRYLRSPAWQQRRRAVLERAAGLCERCCREAATQVHHLTYVHFGAEPLEELQAVCVDCHPSADEERRARDGTDVWWQARRVVWRSREECWEKPVVD